MKMRAALATAEHQLPQTPPVASYCLLVGVRLLAGSVSACRLHIRGGYLVPKLVCSFAKEGK